MKEREKGRREIDRGIYIYTYMYKYMYVYTYIKRVRDPIFIFKSVPVD